MPNVKRLLAEHQGTDLPGVPYAALGVLEQRGAEWVIDEIERSGLSGRGGGSFPAARKWREVHDAPPGPRFVVVNGDEGEPAAWKDRLLLRRYPHLVLEGTALAARAVGAEKAWVYLSDPKSQESVQAALEVARPHLRHVDIQTSLVPRKYVAGEETSAIHFINGGSAIPTFKPPRPSIRGVAGAPTVVNNVETLAHAAWIAKFGATVFREVGADASPGTFLACVSGSVKAPLLVEAPLGTNLRGLVEMAEPTEPIVGVLLGGYFSGFMPYDLADTPACEETLRPLGLGLGNGSIVAVGESTCPVTVISNLLAFFATESAKQCGACTKGTEALVHIGIALRGGSATQEHIDRLQYYSQVLMRRGACSLLDGAAMAADRALRYFSDSLKSHLGTQCASCAGTQLDATGGYSVDIDRVLQI